MTNSKTGYKTKDGSWVDTTDGIVDDDGNYVPTEAECRERWSDIPADRDLSDDNFRMKCWRHPPTRNLIPFSTTTAHARDSQLKSSESRSNRVKKYKADKESTKVIFDLMKEEMSNGEEPIDPYKILQLRLKMAVAEDDWEKVEQLSVTMLEYTKPKLQRTEVKTTEVKVDELSMEEMQEFVNSDMTMEEFLAKQKDK